MDQVWLVGAPIFGAVLMTFGAVLSSKVGQPLLENDGELELVSALSQCEKLQSPECAPSLGRRLFSGFASRAARRAARDVAMSEAGVSPEIAPPLAPVTAQEFTDEVAACETQFGSLLAEYGDAARAAHDREMEEAAAEEFRLVAAARERRQRELEEIAVAEEARVRAEARTCRWFVRLDPDLEAPSVEERMVLASWLAIPAPFAEKLLLQAFEQEDIPRVRARIIGALAGGEHFDDPFVFHVAYDNGGVEKAAVREVLAPRRDDFAWVADLLAR